MYREDLNKLIAIMQKEHSEKYFVRTFQMHRKYTSDVPKIRLNGTYQAELNSEKVAKDVTLAYSRGIVLLWSSGRIIWNCHLRKNATAAIY